MSCDVCNKLELVEPNSTNQDNNILKCSHCKVKVHQACYGEMTFTEKWLCSYCKSSDNRKFRKCELCPKVTGALKPTTNKKWVHVVCALFHPLCIFEDVQKMEPINISGLAKKHYVQRCYICLEKRQFDKKGACVECNEHNCKRNMHVTCGQQAGTLREQPTDKNEIKYVCFCLSHKYKKNVRLEITNIQANLSKRKGTHLKDLVKRQNSEWLLNETDKPVKLAHIEFFLMNSHRLIFTNLYLKRLI
jgi:hypothetical protein